MISGWYLKSYDWIRSLRKWVRSEKGSRSEVLEHYDIQGLERSQETSKRDWKRQTRGTVIQETEDNQRCWRPRTGRGHEQWALTTGLGHVGDMGDPSGSCFGGGWGKNLIKVGSRENRKSTVLWRFAEKEAREKDSRWRKVWDQRGSFFGFVLVLRWVFLFYGNMFVFWWE